MDIKWFHLFATLKYSSIMYASSNDVSMNIKLVILSSRSKKKALTLTIWMRIQYDQININF